MTDTHVKWMTEGLDHMIAECKRLGGPVYPVIAQLETVLAAAYVDTKATVHSPMNPGSPNYVPTGSLLGSGTVSSEYDGESHWEGNIEYGGPTTGPNNPVEYAIYEMARGGAHDFFSGMPAFDEQYLEALNSWYEGHV